MCVVQKSMPEELSTVRQSVAGQAARLGVQEAGLQIALQNITVEAAAAAAVVGLAGSEVKTEGPAYDSLLSSTADASASKLKQIEKDLQAVLADLSEVGGGAVSSPAVSLAAPPAALVRSRLDVVLAGRMQLLDVETTVIGLSTVRQTVASVCLSVRLSA